MNYRLELDVNHNGTKKIFNSIIFDTFKINIIDRYRGNMNYNPIFIESIFKVRTLDDQLIETRGGNNRVILKGPDLENYKILIRTLNSYRYREKQIDQKVAGEKYVHFMISLLVSNYQLS